MKKKSSPELFELIKGKSFKTISQKAEPEATIEPMVKVQEPEYKPVPPVQSPTRAAYPKFKSSFLKKPGAQTPGSKTFTLTYNTAIFLVILVVIALFLAFMWSHWNDLTQSRPDRTGSGDTSRTSTRQPSPPATRTQEPPQTTGSAYYTVQLRSFKADDRPNEIAAGQMVTKLKNAGIDAEKQKEVVKGVSLWIIYAGRFSSENEARSAINNYKKLYKDFDRDFRNHRVERRTK